MIAGRMFFEFAGMVALNMANIWQIQKPFPIFIIIICSGYKYVLDTNKNNIII
jgi:hypothetical protein